MDRVDLQILVYLYAVAALLAVLTLVIVCQAVLDQLAYRSNRRRTTERPPRG